MDTPQFVLIFAFQHIHCFDLFILNTPAVFGQALPLIHHDQMCLFVFLGDSGDRLGATRRKIHPATFVVAKGPTCFVSGQGDVLFMTRVRELLGSDPLFWFMNVSPVTSLRLSLGPFAVIL